ncbi:hypothetical protein N7493_006551 [Penicillium malachiteum]|uniref:Cyanovirin-N domain-containing protein n=1 Tax=Penicillium malachiteum TaxID=1324776 RepID=A0AAD6HLI2_9EURO|nr:hypothetical protein N7493_006551 [Penicillium malachiteum]
MQFSLKSLGMLSLFVIAVSGASKFAETCENIEAYGSTLRADCRVNENGELQPSTLDLNRCIKNGKGSLKCGKNGNYQASCINCSIRGNNELECMCRNADKDHRFVSAHVDLNNCISNDHGELGC